MVTRREATAGILSTAVLAATPGLAAQEAMTVKLPPPRAGLISSITIKSACFSAFS